MVLLFRMRSIGNLFQHSTRGAVEKFGWAITPVSLSSRTENPKAYRDTREPIFNRHQTKMDLSRSISGEILLHELDQRSLDHGGRLLTR